MKYGLIGEKLGHSFSPEIHSHLLTADYTLAEIPKEQLDEFLVKRDFTAINVTIPYKQAVIPYLHYISPQAQEIGAVNTVVNKDGLLYGYNTDFFGLRSLILRSVGDISGKAVLVLGTGGTSHTAVAVARDLKAKEVFTVGRTGKEDSVTYEYAYQNLTHAEIIINTTPVGMYPNTCGTPIDIEKFPFLQGVVDAVFNPICTDLVLKARSLGIQAEGGLYMLVSQGVIASEIFTDTKYPEGTTEKIYNSLLKSKENIVLTGMPGSGKSTVGRLLSKKLSRPLYDMDEEIVKDAGMEISEIFEKYGEAHFRDLETAVAVKLSSLSGAVISCGGGAVLRDENVNALSRNGVIFFIDRPLEQLIPTDDRPLAASKEAIKKRYDERIDRYISTCHSRIKVAGSAEDVMEQIREEFFK